MKNKDIPDNILNINDLLTYVQSIEMHISTHGTDPLELILLIEEANIRYENRKRKNNG